MRVLRAAAICVIVAAALITAWTGADLVRLMVREVQVHGFGTWPAFGLSAGVLAIVTGAACAFFTARDLPGMSLSDRGRIWTWAATVGLCLVLIATVWFALYALVAPLITAVFVWLARGPAARPAL